MIHNIMRLRDEYHDCQRCPELVKNRNCVVFGSKHMKPCPVMIIGEAPGRVEDELCEPFVGKSGQILNMLLSEIGLSSDGVFITNTILCRPPENRNPKVEELANCRGRLDKTIELIDPKVIITLGNFATQYVLETKEGITKVRGKIYEKDGRKIMPMPHPATLLYNGMAEPILDKFKQDFQTVKSLLNDN